MLLQKSLFFGQGGVIPNKYFYEYFNKEGTCKNNEKYTIVRGKQPSNIM